MCLVPKHNIEIHPHHVKSHQDSDIAYNKSLCEAKLNCDVDALANQARTCLHCHNLCTTKYAPPPGHRASLWGQEKWITGHHPLAIREARYRELTKTIIAKTGWDTKEIYDMVTRPRAGTRIASWVFTEDNAFQVRIWFFRHNDETLSEIRKTTKWWTMSTMRKI